MKELKILYLYPDMLELYGDYGNIQVLKYRLEKRGFNCVVDRYSIGDEKPDFKSYDIIFAGGGADNEQSILSEDLIKYKEEIKEAEDEGVFLLLICGAYQLFGKYYKGVEGNIIPGLEIFPYYTEAIADRKKRCIGNIVLDVTLNGKNSKVIGFENHGGQTYDIPMVDKLMIFPLLSEKFYLEMEINLVIQKKDFLKKMSLLLIYMVLFFLKTQNLQTIL